MKKKMKNKENKMKKRILTFLFILSFACTANAFDFSIGTDDKGLYRFPQEMAEWCGLNFDKTPDFGLIGNCFAKICSDCYDSNATEAAAAKKRLEKLRKEAWINAFILSVELKQKYANLTIEEKAEDLQEKGEDSMRTQNAGNSEIEKFLLNQQEDLIRLKAAVIELNVFSVLKDNCRIFVNKGGS